MCSRRSVQLPEFRHLVLVLEFLYEFRVSEPQNEFRLGFVLLLRLGSGLGLRMDTRNSFRILLLHFGIRTLRTRTAALTLTYELV